MASYYAISIDESLNKVCSKGQLDIILRFWDDVNNMLVTRYLASLFLEKCDAVTILNVLNDSLNSFGIKFGKIIQLATDGPNVNLKLFGLFRDYLLIGNPIESKLCDVGACTYCA